MRQNRHCQIHWQISPRQNVMRST